MGVQSVATMPPGRVSIAGVYRPADTLTARAAASSATTRRRTASGPRPDLPTGLSATSRYHPRRRGSLPGGWMEVRGMGIIDWLTNLTVTDFEEKALLVVLGAGAAWLGTRVNSTSQQKRERQARETERRHIFERDSLVDVQDALDELYRVVTDLVLERFPPEDPPRPKYIEVPVEPPEYRRAEARVMTLQERVLDVGIRALVARILEVAGDLVRSGSPVTVHDQEKLLTDLSKDVEKKIGARLRHL